MRHSHTAPIIIIIYSLLLLCMIICNHLLIQHVMPFDSRRNFSKVFVSFVVCIFNMMDSMILFVTLHYVRATGYIDCLNSRVNRKMIVPFWFQVATIYYSLDYWVAFAQVKRCSFDRLNWLARNAWISFANISNRRDLVTSNRSD